MTIQEQVNHYLASLPDTKREEMEALHQRMLNILPKGKWWFLDGRDEKGKIVSNPNIGYGALTINYAGGKTREFYQIGLSANTKGISVYIMGIKDKTYLPTTYGKTIGKARVTGYCITFKSLKDIHLHILEDAIRNGMKQNS